MPKSNDQRSDTRPTHTKPPPGNVVPPRPSRDADSDQLSKWINLGDQVLGNSVDSRKKG
jgi:hypothetical protein